MPQENKCIIEATIESFMGKDVCLKTDGLTVAARWNCSQNTWKIPIKRFIFSKVANFWPATLLYLNYMTWKKKLANLKNL